MIDDQTPEIEPDTPSPITEHHKDQLAATPQLNRTREWTPWGVAGMRWYVRFMSDCGPRLYIDGTKVTGHELGEPFDILTDAYTIYRHQQTDRQRSKGQRRTYHQTSGSVTVTDELAAIRNQPELPHCPHSTQRRAPGGARRC